MFFQGQKKSKKKRAKKNVKDKTDKSDDETGSSMQIDTGQGHGTGEGHTVAGKDNELHQAWFRMSSSESEWSDTEGGQGSRLRSNFTRVRQCALSCFFWIVKVITLEYRGYYMSAHVLLNLLKELRKRDKIQALPSM